MKLMIALTFALTVTSVVQASLPVFPNPDMPGLPNVQVYYASWCEGQMVVNGDLQGRPQARFSCEQTNRVCRQEERRVSASQIIVSASCWYK